MSVNATAIVLSIGAPWRILRADVDPKSDLLIVMIGIDPMAELTIPGRPERVDAVDSVVRHYRHPAIMGRPSRLEIQIPRVRLPDGDLSLIEPEFIRPDWGFEPIA